MIAAVTLGLGDYGVIGVMLGVVATIIVALTLGNIKALALMITALGIRIDRIEDRVTKVEQDKVSHQDWVRVVASQHNRQDYISRQLAELGGRVDSALGVNAGLRRIAEAVEERAEKP